MLLSNDFSCVGIEVTGGDQVTGGDRDFGTFLCLEETWGDRDRQFSIIIICSSVRDCFIISCLSTLLVILHSRLDSSYNFNSFWEALDELNGGSNCLLTGYKLVSEDSISI